MRIWFKYISNFNCSKEALRLESSITAQTEVGMNVSTIATVITEAQASIALVLHTMVIDTESHRMRVRGSDSIALSSQFLYHFMYQVSGLWGISLQNSHNK